MKGKKYISVLMIVVLLSFTATDCFAADNAQVSPQNLPQTQQISAAEMSQHNDSWGFAHKDGVVLALSGGGTKGLAHIGVMEVLEREHIPVAAIVGTSMGSIIGGLFATGWSAQEARETLPKMNLIEVISGRKGHSLAFESTSYPPHNNERLLNINISNEGKIGGIKALLNSKNLYSLLTELTSRVSETDFDKFPIPYAALATDISTGETVQLRSGVLASAMRASMAFPGIFEPWERDGRLLVDGGLKANLPVLEAKKMFPGHPVIAVNLSPQKLDVPKERMKSAVNVLAQTIEILMHDQTVENCDAADVVIQVDCTGLGILDASGYDDIMNRGKTAAEQEIDKIKDVMNKYHAYIPPQLHTGEKNTETPYVKEVVIQGVPKNMNRTLQAKYQNWVDKPLDMAKISDAVTEISQRSEVSTIEPKVENLSRDTVRVTLDVKPQPKYEFSFSGYSSNLNPDRWASVAALGHNMLMEGDSADIEARLGTNSGAILRYFTALNRHNMQFGITGAVLQEKNYYTDALASEDFLSTDSTFTRYSGKAMIYKNFANNKVRLGVGYAVGRTNADEIYYPLTDPVLVEDHTHRGIAATIGINSLDDPIVPTKGFALMSDIWFPHGETIYSRTEFTAKLPLKSNWLLSLTGGLNTAATVKNPEEASFSSEDFPTLPYAAWLGTRNELWTLASDPLFGEEAYWAKLSATKVLMKSWWGGINTEFFAAYGRATSDWNTEVGHAWEVGVQLGIPTNFLPGSIILAYGQNKMSPDARAFRSDRNEFIIGYTIGIPKWWKGPLP